MTKKENTKLDKQNIEGSKEKFDRMIQIASTLNFAKNKVKKAAKNLLNHNLENHE